MAIFLFILIGAIYGSFLNMLLWRLPKGESIHGRSYCTSCRRQLRWYDLVPILSYLALRGHCRACHAKIPVRYLLVEVVCASVVALIGYISGGSLIYLAFSVYIAATMLSLVFFDLMYFVLPDAFTIPAIIIASFFTLLYQPDPIYYFVTALLSGLFFAILYLASRGRWLGFGDVKLAILIGLLLGWPVSFWAIISAIWAAAAVGLILMAMGKATMKHALPFGAFLAAMSLAAMIFHNELNFLQTLFG